MPGTLQGRNVALAECRQAEVLARMFEAEGAVAHRYPLVAILDALDTEAIRSWIQKLIDRKLDCTIFLTGEGIRRLHAFSRRENTENLFLSALTQVKLVTRGPKPVAALKELGLAPHIVAEKPTTEGVVASLKKVSLNGLTIGVQWYGEPVPLLVNYLQEIGATLVGVTPYRYAPEADSSRVIELIQRLETGKFDLLVFTSSPQIARLREVAEANHLAEALHKGLNRTPIAAVGPIAAESIKSLGYEVAIVPEQGFVMKNLVQQIKRRLG